MLLSLERLDYGYGNVAILRNFSLSLEHNAHHLLLGPSGSGKTTLINLICGLLSPHAGTITIAGEPMTGIGATARDDLRRRRIGIVFQTLRLISALDIHANLMLAQRLAGEPADRKAVNMLLERVGIAHRAHARPRDLSQGEAQRAAIARALVGKPDLLIADEPTSALDDASMTRVAQLLLDSADANGSTLLIATHDARLKAMIPHNIMLQTPLPEVA